MSSVETTDKRNVRNVRIVRILSVLTITYCVVFGYCALVKFEFTGLFKLVFRFRFYKMSSYLHLQEML